MSRMVLHFDGVHTFDEVREGLGAALDALGEPSAEWVVVHDRALVDRNGAGLAFERTWRRGEATLEAAARSGAGNPRDGYGYDLSLALDARPWSFRWAEGAMDARLYGLRVPFEGPPEAFCAARAAMAAALGGDLSGRGASAVENLGALEGVDTALQRELLLEALRHSSASEQAHAALLRWRERLLGSDLAARLVESPADLEAWERASRSPPAGFSGEHVRAVLARLAPWDPARPAHPLAAAWSWIPALGGGGSAPAGWRQLDDGVNPTWERPALANGLVHALDPELAARASLAVGGARLERGLVGGASARAVGGRPLPRMHVSWIVTEPAHFAPHATVDWIWGEGLDDVAVLASRSKPGPPAPVALYLAGTKSFRVRVLRALHAMEPFAWRLVARPLEGAFAAARPAPRGSREEVAALLAALPDVDPLVPAAFEACRCTERWCEHARTLIDASRANRSAQQRELDPRAFTALGARALGYDAAEVARRDRSHTAALIAEANRALDRLRAMTDAPELPR